MSTQTGPVPIPSFAATPQLVSLRAPKRSYVLHNASGKPRSPMFIGNLITIPPAHEVGPHSDVDADGDPIPGTRVIEDVTFWIPELGEEEMILDANRCVIHILGLQPSSDGKATTANSAWALGGISLLPRHATKEQIKQIKDEGGKRVFTMDVQRAEDYITWLDEKNAKRQAANMAPVPGGMEYERARFMVEQRDLLMKRMVQDQMGLTPGHVPDLGPSESDLDDELEMEAFVKAAALSLATKTAVSRAEAGTAPVDKTLLAEELLADPVVRKNLEKKFKIRKRGSMPPTPEQLEKAAQEGTPIEE